MKRTAQEWAHELSRVPILWKAGVLYFLYRGKWRPHTVFQRLTMEVAA